MTKQNLFPRLNFELLQQYADRWARELADYHVREIRLFRYVNKTARLMGWKSSAKYAVVFFIENESEPQTYDVAEEDYRRTIYDVIEYFHSVYDEHSYSSLLDASFSEVYLAQPPENYKQDWIFTTGKLAEQNPSFKMGEEFWQLYPDAHAPMEAATPAPAAKKKSSLNKKQILALQVKEKARKIAKILWKKDPTITKSDMAMQDEINSIPGACEFRPETIEEWIKDLNPNPNPGRRKKA